MKNMYFTVKFKDLINTYTQFNMDYFLSSFMSSSSFMAVLMSPWILSLPLA